MNINIRYHDKTETETESRYIKAAFPDKFSQEMKHRRKKI